MSALVTYMTQMLTSLMTLIDVFKLLIRARTSVRRVEEVLALPEEGTLEGPEETGVEEPVLELRHVTFAYPGGSGVPALQDISFTLRRGERLAVVGPTGAGLSLIHIFPSGSGTMTYQLPGGLKLDKKIETDVIIDVATGNSMGTYSIDTNGLVTMNFTGIGRGAAFDGKQMCIRDRRWSHLPEA